MSTTLGLFLDPFTTDAEESENWLVLRLVVRALGALWLGVALLVAVLHQFVVLVATDDDAVPNER